MKDVARRSLTKVTYAPIRPSPEDEASGLIEKRQRGLEKVVYAGALRPQPSEVQAVKGRLDPQAGRPVIEALDAMVGVTSRRRSRTGWPALSAVPAEALISAGRALADHRRDQRTQLLKQAEALAGDHAAYLRKKLEGEPDKPPTPPPGATSVAAWHPQPAADPRLSTASLKSTFGDALAWARVADPRRADALVFLATRVAGVDTNALPTVAGDGDVVTGVVVDTFQDTDDWTDDLVDGFTERMAVEPIGRLFLERIDMTPAGVLRGELVHSVGLAPKETVTVIHREWSSREVSFEKVVTEEFEQSTEEGVTENTELSQAIETQSRHSTALSMEATGSGSWGFASASASVGYHSTSDDETNRRDSRNHAIQVTRKASARSRTEHKSTFTVKEQAGVEDQSVRTLTNPSKSQPMRIDFHQMLRDWKVDLYRYDERLTYDIVVPAPGIDLLANIDELRRIDYQLSRPFVFPLIPADITREKWQELAGSTGADVEPPGPETIQLTQSMTYPVQTEDEADQPRFDALEFDVPPGYVVSTGSFQAFVVLHSSGHFDVPADSEPPIGHTDDKVRAYESTVDWLKDRTGHVIIVMACNLLRSGYAQATLELVQTLDGWQAWQNQAWTAMHKSAEDRYQVQRQDLQQRRDQLAEDLGKWDPLTLRRMEREEIMKTTLKWIFGPAFDLMPSEVVRLYGADGGGFATLEPAELTVRQWAQVMGLGEFIKFLHEAIEWENVLFFVYPYFWDHPQNQAFKRFLKHPDGQHQEFLRGGAARVVLTVRPGFEKSFTRLFEAGDHRAELGDHPYLTIAEEIQAFAKTHYPGIPAADGDDPVDAEAVDIAQRGELIAQWHEYTPISALDITVNTPLAELR